MIAQDNCKNCNAIARKTIIKTLGYIDVEFFLCSKCDYISANFNGVLVGWKYELLATSVPPSNGCAGSQVLKPTPSPTLPPPPPPLPTEKLAGRSGWTTMTSEALDLSDHFVSEMNRIVWETAENLARLYGKINKDNTIEIEKKDVVRAIEIILSSMSQYKILRSVLSKLEHIESNPPLNSELLELIRASIRDQ